MAIEPDDTVDTSVAETTTATTTDAIDDQFTKVFGALDEDATTTTKDTSTNKASATATGATDKGGTTDKGKADRAGSDDSIQPQEGYKPVLGIKGHFIDQKTGNVVNAAGEIIARRGIERERFLGDIKEVRNVGTMRAELAKANEQLETYKNANVIATKAGLDAQGIMFGMNLAAAWKNDRKAVLNHLLTAAREKGDNLDDLGIAGGGIDINALKSTMAELIKEHLQPFQPYADDRKKLAETAAMQVEINAEVETFYNTHPDSRTHSAEIASIIEEGAKAGTEVTPTQAYIMLVRYAADEMLDFTKPLRPQVDGSTQRREEGDEEDQPQPRRRSGIPPTGAGGRQGTGVSKMQPRVADPDASWDNILRDVLTETQGQR